MILVWGYTANIIQRLIGRSVLVIAFEVLATTRLAQKPKRVRLFSGAVICERCNLRGIDLKSRDLSRDFLRSCDLTRAILTQANLSHTDSNPKL
ncbi:pentapeptide repeat-containing protein [Microcoleus sp. FACHB-53]|nr:pentapeptide repeat-containing protein [Microcoleus sp. FACHB-53]